METEPTTGTETTAPRPLTVRRGRVEPTHADERFIASLATSSFAPYGDYALLSQWVRGPDVITLIAEQPEGGQPDEAKSGFGARCGFAMVAFYVPDHASDSHRPTGKPHQRTAVADLIALAVAPRAQRAGVGARLLSSAIDLAQAAAATSGIKELRLTVADTNAVARRLFTRAGFGDPAPPTAHEEGLYAGGQKALRMVYRLAR